MSDRIEQSAETAHTPDYSDATVTVWAGDCLDVLRRLPEASVDAVVTDPPYGLEFMGKEWDGADGFRRSLNPADVGRDNAFGRTSRTSPEFTNERLPRLHAFQEWCEAWARECLRVLRPGGHMLAFGGSRTWHRLACAVEDAGFEVRDSIAWMYGSGFPKSLDVSKAIDKAAGAEREIVGLNPRAAQQTPKRDVTSLGAFAGTSPNLTAPATDAARTWEGWGTALKPAHEPIVVARKPLASPGVNVLAAVELGLRERGIEGEIRWTTRPASDAARRAPQTSSSSTEAPLTAATSAAPADASATPSDGQPSAKSSATGIPHGEQPTAITSAPTPDARPESSETKCSTPTEASAPAAASESATSSPSTTSTEAGRLTERPPGGRSTSRSSEKDSRPATESFAGIATGLTGSWATVRIDRLADGTCVWPDGLPRNTAGGSTVAANVLAHGTGALNIDGCRVGMSDADRAKIDNMGGFGSPGWSRADGTQRDTLDAAGRSGPLPSIDAKAHSPGRWPANVVLDEAMARELDAQSGESLSRVGKPRGADHGDGWGMTATGAEYDDRGGASRFFYVAKADASERVWVNGTAHPTVKPLDLMRWLVRLVTPPGGTVLEPFAGSGTTVEACILEGFRCIAIEREETYLPLIRQRIHRRRDPVAAVRATEDDGGLFDLLGEEPA